MLYYPDETVQHAGVILGLGGVAGQPLMRSQRMIADTVTGLYVYKTIVRLRLHVC